MKLQVEVLEEALSILKFDPKAIQVFFKFFKYSRVLIVTKNVSLILQNNFLQILVDTKAFFSMTRTSDELSLVAKTSLSLQDHQGLKNVSPNWRALRIVGELDFSLIGILAKISNILAEANISVFVISTFNTDYILVKEDKLEEAVVVLKANDIESIN